MAEEEKKTQGLLGKGLDPVGNVLGKGLAPVGSALNATLSPVTNTVGGGVQPVMDTVMGPAKKGEQAGNVAKTQNKPYEKYGGKDQTADNPLGL